MKPSNPTKHHYVPRVYLKRFADENSEFFQFSKQYKTISQKHISKVGYKHDYFKIQREETKLINSIQDEYYIEKNGFTQQENNFNKLASLVSQKLQISFEMRKIEVEILLQTIITIKRRNPSTRQQLTDNLKKEAASGTFERIFEPFRELAQKVDNADPMIYLNKEKNEFINDPSKSDDLYLSSFIDQSKVVREITKTFFQSAIQIYHAPEDSQFVTSDNPGFFVSGNEIINFGGLGGSYLFAFPISPETCLIIDSDESGYPSIHHTTIIPKVCTKKQVDYINYATTLIANGNVFVKDRQYAEQVKSQSRTNQ
ncbi:DUF4238 domain-containing protein [Sphingobacterium bambusae]|uniref:DUF4238 domain-containing protein n=1 Tax=Sphingobacterium bambusae TaxID=662858 RepID=A0ABW6BDA8_9SPHI|nr:DUF4238 domain-containing protein [Sphingobacterium bambusae]WPL48797.1 DUF4238 domain-containing protein [Sphingobacterium bambusae]